MLVAIPRGVVTEIGPLVVPAATVAVIWVLLFTVKALAAVPLNATAVAPVRLTPVIVTGVPVPPEVGEKLVMVTAVKLVADVALPPRVVTVIGPVLVPPPTTAVICVFVFARNEVAAVPLNETAVAVLRSVPVIVTEVPVPPEVGVKVVIVGAGTTVKLAEVDPPGVVSATSPLVAPDGTVVVICVAETTVYVG